MDEKPSLKRSASDLDDLQLDIDGGEHIKKARINGEETVNGEHECSRDIESNGLSAEFTPETSGSSKPSYRKIPSVQRDAEIIATVVPDVNVSIVYDQLISNRADPNRLDVVTTQLFESNSCSEKQTNSAVDGEKPTDKPSLYEDVKAVVHKVKKCAPHIKLNPAEIYVLLERYASDSDRANIVVDLFLQDSNSSSKEECNASDIFQDVEDVIKKVSGASPDLVYELLESLAGQSDRVQQVINKFSTKPAMKKDDSLPSDPALRNDPVFMDMRKVAKMFPEIDRNEIYAYIEAHHDKKDRVQIVIDELLRGAQGSLEQSTSLVTAGVEVVGKPKFQGACGLQGEVDQLREIFPDCDPNYLFEELEKRADDAERVKNLAATMFETRNFPRLKDVIEQQEKVAKKQEIRNLKFDLNNFLAKFPEPEEFFSNTETAMSDSYKEHCLAYVKNEFVWFKDGYLKKVLEKHSHHLVPALREMTDVRSDFEEENRASKKLRTEARHKRMSYPEEPDERFYHELLFWQNEQRIKDHFYMLDLERKRKIVVARKKGELYECGCCFDDELLFEDLSACADGHLFCRECIRRSTESALGEAKTKFPCLTGECEYDIPFTVLQDVLSAKMFSRLLSRLQEEEIRQADIPDLVSCPFCSFATIMPDPSDKVFKCLNQECLKETCRMCKEPNHVPLKCSEIEKQGETSMRTYIENRISESMLRTCHRCKKRFFKDFGCNKMTCTCGATMCYVCRTPDIDYDHFNDGRCNATEDAEAIHLQEMEKAAQEAKEQYLRDHPEASEQSLKYDPKKHVEEYKHRFGENHGRDEDSYDEDDYDEENHAGYNNSGSNSDEYMF